MRTIQKLTFLSFKVQLMCLQISVMAALRACDCANEICTRGTTKNVPCIDAEGKDPKRKLIARSPFACYDERYIS